MINLLISINPFKSDNSHLITQKIKMISDNKYLEFEVYITDKWFEFMLSTDYKGSDHAGPKLSITLFRIEFFLSIVDRRHWDYENNKWYDALHFE